MERLRQTRMILAGLLAGALILTGCDKGKPRHLPPDPFAAPPPLPGAADETPREGLSAGLPRRPGMPGFFLDHIGAAIDPMNKPPQPLTPGAPLLVDGFGFDAAAKLPAKGMDVVIDGKAFGARYGHARGDVATYFKTPALANTGFRVVLPPEMVGPGSHSVTLRIVAADGKAYDETPPVGFTLR